MLAVDRATRRWIVSQSRRQLDAATDAYERLYPGDDSGGALAPPLPTNR